MAAYAVVPAAFAIAPIHFTGFFLSEVPGIATVALALLVSAYGVSLAKGAAEGLPGFLIGLSWGLAASVRPQNLIVGIGVIILVGFLRWRRIGRDEAIPITAAGIMGFLIWMAPFAYRCSNITGSFCPVSANGLLNSVMGFSGDVALVRFSDAEWVPPAKIQHGMTGSVALDVSMFDTTKLLGILAESLWNHPLDSFVAFLGNGFDLFGQYLMLIDEGPVPRRYYVVGQQIFLLGVIFPALASLRRTHTEKRGEESAQVEIFFVVTLALVFFIHAASLGESRYRLPYDGILCVLAASFYTGEIPALRERRNFRGGALLLVLLAGLWVIIVGLITPGAGIQPIISAFRFHHLEEANENRVMIPCIDALPSTGSGGDIRVGINMQFNQDIHVPFSKIVTANRLKALFDWNDSYRIVFKNGDSVVGERFVMGDNPGDFDGMTLLDVPVPPMAVHGGFDSLSIRVVGIDGQAIFGGVLCPPAT